jgi:hypothetical protein
MDKVTARRVSALLEAAIAKLSETLEVTERSVTPDEYETLKRGAGIAIGRISHEMLDPIYRQHPDLAPPGVL